MQNERKLHITPFLIIGFLSGAILAILENHHVSHSLPYIWISVYAFMFLLAYQNATSLTRLLVVTLIPSFLASMPFVWHYSNFPSTSFLVLSAISAYALNAFHIVYQSHRFRMQYESLFYAVWDTFIKLIIAAIFTGICWLILQLWGELFNLLGITWFSTLFKKIWFVIWSIPFFSSIGLYIATDAQKVVRNLRIVILTICKFLLPVLAMIGILFVISWLISLDLFHHRLNFSTNLLVWYSFLAIIFTNGVYQDGREAKPYNKVLLCLVTIFLAIIPIFSLLALYSVFQNITAKSLNAHNFYQLIVILLILIYSICYALIAIRKERQWLKSVGKINIILAIVVISVTLLINNFWFQNARFNPGKINPYKQQSPEQRLQKAKQLYLQLENQLKAKKFSWQKSSHSQPIGNALVMGGANNKPIYLCRSQIKGQYYGGVVNNDRCQVIYNNAVILKKSYVVLTGNPDRLVWDSSLYLASDNKKFRVVVGFIPPYPTYVCRTIYDDRIVVGTYHDFRCFFVGNNKIVKTSSFLQLLYVRR